MSESYAEATIRAFQGQAFNIDGWVVMYPSISDTRGPLFVNVGDPNRPWSWGGGTLNWCTVFETYDQAAKAATQIPYIMKQPPHLRRILKLKIQHTVELIEERPIELLDALAEL